MNKLELEKRRNLNKKILKFGCLSFVILGFIVVFLAILVGSDEKSLNVDKSLDTEKKIIPRKEQLRPYFSHIDGSHINLTKLIKENMNDPKSYEHVKTTYMDLDSVLIVTMKYRGNNVFGGKVLNTVMAEIDIKGNIREIINL